MLVAGRGEQVEETTNGSERERGMRLKSEPVEKLELKQAEEDETTQQQTCITTSSSPAGERARES